MYKSFEINDNQCNDSFDIDCQSEIIIDLGYIKDNSSSVFGSDSIV